jgi:hypothetical protein
MSCFKARSSTARRVRVVPLVWFLVASIALVACGGAAVPPSGGGQTTTPGGQATPGAQATVGQPTPGQRTPGGQAVVTGADVCKLIPDAAWDSLAAALKVKLVKAAEDPCRRSTDDELGEVNVSVSPGRDEIRQMKSICSGAGPKTITGIGDEAIWCPVYKTLVVGTNGQTVSAQATLFTESVPTDDAILVALQSFMSAIVPIVPKGPQPVAAGSNRACALSTTQELETALGEPFDPPTDAESRTGLTACDYERHNLAGVVSFRIYDDVKQYAGSKSGWDDPVDVAGIGDAAFWVPSAKFLDAICRGKVVEVQIVFLEKEGVELRPAAETLAKTACSRV